MSLTATIGKSACILVDFMDSAPSITIRGIRYSFVRKRERQNISVYRSRSAYLRLGPPRLIANERAYSEALLRANFPVPNIIARGTYRGQWYSIEQSIGTKQFGKYFISDCGRTGEISARHMASFIRIVSRYTDAQLATRRKKKDWAAFARSVHLSILQKELPAKSVRLRSAYARAAKRLLLFPFVLSHGDFNPHNIFPRGVIDLEQVCFAPAGYDALTALSHIDMFPDDPSYEYHRLYSFSRRQKESYLAMIDQLFCSAGLPAPSRFAREFRLCRMLWSAARMQRYPRLQKWRYRLLDSML
ncbi:phosphotransferase [Candidatus Uhrbacteria bacterium]|nr:phosphotransferase [Candidatus Uhrbacteria bacterium]